MDDLEFHILAIDDDPLVLSEIELMYKEMLQFNDFDPIFGENSKGYITTVSNTIKGERVLQENFEKNPNLVQILHLDQNDSLLINQLKDLKYDNYEDYSSSKKEIEKMSELRDKLIEGIIKIEATKLNGPKGEKRLCNNVNISFAGIEGEAIGGYLDQKFICSSTGSACSEALLEPSHVLMAIGLSHEAANGSLRLTLSKYTTEEDINKTLETIPKVVKKLRKISPFGKVMDYVFRKNN